MHNTVRGLRPTDNLGVLRERDAELETLDATVAALNRDLDARFVSAAVPVPKRLMLTCRNSVIGDLQRLVEEKSIDLSSLRCTLSAIGQEAEERVRVVKAEHQVSFVFPFSCATHFKFLLKKLRNT